MMRVVAFYTSGSPYAIEAERLHRSLESIGLAHSIIGVPPVSDWDAGVAWKCRVLRMARDAYAGGLLYIDVDAVVHADCSAYFDGLDGRFDFAAHWFQGPSGGHDRTRNDDWFLSGTMWFADTMPARALLAAWADRNRELASAGVLEGAGQANLAAVLDMGIVDDLRVHRLPGRYCFVFDKPWAYPDGEPRIIEHLIASRENRGASRGRINHSRRQRIAELDAAAGGPPRRPGPAEPQSLADFGPPVGGIAPDLEGNA